MAILGNIRKRPIFLVMIIGLALFAFVISSAFDGNGSSRPTAIGSINGEDINAEEFSRRVEAQKGNSQNGSSLRTVNTVWDAMVREKIYDEQIEKAGIVIGEQDIWNAVVNNPNFQNNPNYKNEEGLFDENKLKEYIATLKSTPDGKRNWLNFEKSIVANLRQSTYDDLVKSGLTASVKEGQRFYNSENIKADIQYVYEPFSSIKKTEVTVTDAEIATYIKNHADQFNADATREVSYVNFIVKPSAADISIVKNEISQIINDFVENDGTKVIGFKNTTDNAAFVTEFSDINHTDKIFFTKDLATGIYDSILKVGKGNVYGPYKDNDYFKITKYIADTDEKSVKASHILIAYAGAQNAKPSVTRTKEEAEKKANSLRRQVNATNFSVMAKTNSDGPSATKGGSLGDWAKKGKFVTEFENFIFANRKGKIDVVETVFGYHIIIVDDVKTEAGLTLATVALKLDASQETESNIYQQAETFASDLIDGKDMQELAKTGNYQIKKANNIKELSENIIGLGNQRDIVRWAFEKKTKKGAVKRFDLDNSFVIVKLENRYKKGLTSLAVAKPRVTPILEKIKKSKLISAKMTGTSLDEVAKAIGKTVNSSNAISLTNTSLTTGEKEDKVAGAILYMKEGDFKLIEGNNGVYAVKIIKKIQPHDIKKYDVYSKNISSKLKNKSNLLFNALKEGSEVEDQRTLFY